MVDSSLRRRMHEELEAFASELREELRLMHEDFSYRVEISSLSALHCSVAIEIHHGMGHVWIAKALGGDIRQSFQKALEILHGIYLELRMRGID